MRGLATAGGPASRFLLGLWLCAQACADAPFERTNAYDSRLDIPGLVVGLPGRIESRGTFLALRLDAGAAYEDVPRHWSVWPLPSPGCNEFGGYEACGVATVVASTGAFEAHPSLIPRRFEIRVRMGAQEYRDTVMLEQRPDSFAFNCTTPCGVTAAFNAPVDLNSGLWTLYDANGFTVATFDEATRRMGETYAVSDAAVIAPVDGVLRSRFAEGDAWIIRRQFALVDSVLWRVAQRATPPPELICPTEAVQLGDTVTATARMLDPNGYPLVRPIAFSWQAWSLVSNVPIEPVVDGTFVPTEVGPHRIYVVMVEPEHHWNSCVFEVLP